MKYRSLAAGAVAATLLLAACAPSQSGESPSAEESAEVDAAAESMAPVEGSAEPSMAAESAAPASAPSQDPYDYDY